MNLSISYNQLHVTGFLVRLALMLYGEWQDKNLEVNFTDVDYHVFTDAAKYVHNGESPFNRPTYRYTPLVAWLLVPCYIIHILWGKFVFICTDVLTGVMIQKTLQLLSHDIKTIKVSLLLWLFNPITMTISSRGNAESIMSALIISTIYNLHAKQVTLAGMLFGLSVHFKIFPLVYALSIFLFLGNDVSLKELTKHLVAGKLSLFVRRVFTWENVKFFVAAGIILLICTVGFWLMYGYDFVQHAYLYHITRKDIRHNFSVYFYMMYTNSYWWMGILCFAAQAILTLVISAALYKKLALSLFLLTFSFVTFNKICTSQYFLWYITIIPLVVPNLQSLGHKKVLFLTVLWGLGQSFWLAFAYRLEFLGESVFSQVWIASVIFFFANVVFISQVLKHFYSRILAMKKAK